MDGVEIRMHGGEDEVLRAVAEISRVVDVKQASPIRQDGRHTYCVWVKARLRPVEDRVPAA